MFKTIRQHVTTICLLHLALFVAMMVFLSTVMQDRLLFKTDGLTLGFFLGALSLLLLLLLLPPFFLALYFLKKTRLPLKIIYAWAVTFMVFYSILMNLFNNPFIFQSQSLKQLLLVNLLCVALAAGGAKKICDRTVFEKIMPVSRWLLLVILVFVSAAKIYFLLPRLEARTPKPKNVILVVLDSLSTSVIREYAPGADSAVAGISARYALFEDMRTNFTYTYGYFDALFKGSKSAPRSRKKNLLSLLQQQGVNTRWLAAQGNAVPDNHAVKNYRGLRSYFFNYRFTWLPAWLGIDYNIYRAPFKKDGRMIYAAHRAIDFFSGRRTDLAGEVMREIAGLQRDARPFFFLIHEFPACETSRPYKLWETGDVKTRRERIGEKIKGNDYAYAPDEEWLVREWEAKSLADVRAGFACLKKIQVFLQANRWAEDTLIVLTADHGKIFKNNKVWYGFHNDEEVARVPLVVFNSTLPERTAGLGETIDITQTVLEHFAVEQKLDPNAFSLFADRPKNQATTLTEYSTVRREQFLNFYKDTAAGMRKFVVDPGEQETVAEYALADGKETFVKRTVFTESPLRDEIRGVFSAYGIIAKNDRRR